MFILEETRKIIKLYIDALPILRKTSDGKERLKWYDLAQDGLGEILQYLDKTADGTSVNAAKMQKQLLDAACKWASNFSYGNIYSDCLHKAIDIARAWSELPPPKKGLLRILSGGPKEAAPGDYITYERAMEDPTNNRMYRISQYDASVEKMNEFKALLAYARKKFPNGLSDPENPSKRQLDDWQKRLDAREDDFSYILADIESSSECEDADAFLERLAAEQPKKTDEPKATTEPDRHKDVLLTLEQTYESIQAHQSDISTYVTFVSLLSLPSIMRIFDGTASEDDIMTTTNFVELVEYDNNFRMQITRELEDLDDYLEDLDDYLEETSNLDHTI